MNHKKNFVVKSGFTLAEVLLVVSIVGVIAALTLATLIPHYQNDTLVVRLKRVIQNIESATENIMYDEGKTTFAATSAWTNDKEQLGRFLDTYFLTTSRQCDDSNSTGTAQNPNPKHRCFAKGPYTSIAEVDYDMIAAWATNRNAVVQGMQEFWCEGGVSRQLADSSTICVQVVQPREASGDINSNNYQAAVNEAYFDVQLDINGPNGPNKGGRDMFNYRINPVTGLTDGTISEKICDHNFGTVTCRNVIMNSEEDIQNACLRSALGKSCTYILANNGYQMNYDTDWNQVHSSACQENPKEMGSTRKMSQLYSVGSIDWCRQRLRSIDDGTTRTRWCKKSDPTKCSCVWHPAIGDVSDRSRFYEQTCYWGSPN